MNIAFAIASGRPHVKKVISCFLDNMQLHGHNPKDFSVYLAIDTKYMNSKESEFILDSNIVSAFKKVQYIFEKDRDSISVELIEKYAVSESVATALIKGNGYSKQRNSAILQALADNNDAIIFIDDDEVPYIPIKKENGQIIWKNLDFFGSHIDAILRGADVTRGPYMGYQSPVPSDFENNVPAEIRQKLGEALELGSDVITSKSFFNMMNHIQYLNEEEINNPTRPVVVKPGPFGKHIYAGNMGINLNSVRQGKVPAFFTPPNSRGEDTIFALQINHLNVIEVPAYIFHDPFDVYPEILNKKFPSNLKSIPVNSKTIERFRSALEGWLKYAPILLFLKHNDKTLVNKIINKMNDELLEPTNQLSIMLNSPKFAEANSVLRTSMQKLQQDVNMLYLSQWEWNNKIKNLFFSEPQNYKNVDFANEVIQEL